MNLYGVVHVLSLLFLTAVVAYVMGGDEHSEAGGGEAQPAWRPVLGCWGRILGGLAVIAAVVAVLGRFAGE